MVFIMLGTNNLPVDLPCAIIAGLKKVIEPIWPMAQIAFLNIPPRGEGFVEYNNNRVEINEAINKVPGIKTINVDEEITCGWKNPCPNYALDNLHFSPAGYAIIFKHLTRIGTWK